MMVIPLILLAEVGLYVRHKPIFYLVFGILFFVSQSFGLLVSVLPLGELNDYLVSYTEGEYASTEYLEGHNIFFWSSYDRTLHLQYIVFCLFSARMFL